MGRPLQPRCCHSMGWWSPQIRGPLQPWFATPWGGGHLKFDQQDLFSLGVSTPWGGGHMSWEDLFSLGVATPWGGGHLKFDDLFSLGLPLHGEVDTLNSINKTSSPLVFQLHGAV